MGTVTLGVSIAVPEPYGSLLQQRRTDFGDTAALGIPTHVTLLPPTEVRPGERPAVDAHLAAVAARTAPFAMRLRGTDSFRPLTPVVFVRVVEGAEECARLQRLVRGGDGGDGAGRADGTGGTAGPLARELQFPYHPHVTVAHGIDEAAMDRAAAELADFEAAWTAGGFALYEQGAGDGVWRLRRAFTFAEGGSHAASARTTGRPSP
ncbi:2'-5' RNA ligase family protein [Streptomyces polyrhachis]|uniref:2'-5' RNA ligase family protein n=1 Tax=Streptomyces polyrhachis TaxID=1282885 RepID=A0ABW2GCU1_9ACTN